MVRHRFAKPWSGLESPRTFDPCILRETFSLGPGRVVSRVGALHDGHATLIRTAREIAGPDGEVVVEQLPAVVVPRKATAPRSPAGTSR